MATARDSNVLLWALNSSRPGNLRLFALRQGQIGQLNCPRSPLSIAISDNGRLVAAGSSDGNVYVWRLRPAQTAGPFTGLGSSPSDVALSADGTMVAACVSQQTMVWDINTGDIVSRMPTSASCYRIAFSPDGRRLLTVGQANEISVWNVEDGQMIETLSARNSNFIGVATAVHYLPDPRGAVSTGSDGVIRVWRLPD
jgi:WD40 repeat protein